MNGVDWFMNGSCCTSCLEVLRCTKVSFGNLKSMLHTLTDHVEKTKIETEASLNTSQFQQTKIDQLESENQKLKEQLKKIRDQLQAKVASADELKNELTALEKKYNENVKPDSVGELLGLKLTKLADQNKNLKMSNQESQKKCSSVTS